MDNENTEVEVTNEEVTTSTIDLANTEVPVEVPPEYAHIPEKFIVEGEPDYTKLAESYKSLEGKRAVMGYIINKMNESQNSPKD